MLVKKRVEMWDAEQQADGNWIITDRNGNEMKVSDAEFHDIYQEVPDRHASRRRTGDYRGIPEETEADGEV